jgi:hypothetical protein
MLIKRTYLNRLSIAGLTGGMKAFPFVETKKPEREGDNF